MKKSLLFSLIIMFAFVTCSKDDDDSNGNGYNGQIAFYTTLTDCGTIVIQLNGENAGNLTSAYTGTSAPTCGDAITLTIGMDVGVHDYYATDDCTHIWTGSIIINKGDCKVKLLD